MKYNKPELTNLGDAASVILGRPKQFPGFIEFFSGRRDFVPAYDLDE